MPAVTTEKLDLFIAALQEQQNAHFAKNFPKLKPPVLSYEVGKKYVRIVTKQNADDQYGSVFCFIEQATGNILKAAGWKAPAKGARGNIWTDTHGVEYLGPYGAAYLRG